MIRWESVRRKVMYNQSVLDMMRIGKVNGFGIALLVLVAIAFVVYTVRFFKNKNKKD